MSILRSKRFGALVAVVGLFGAADAQYPANNVVLRSQVSLNTFGAQSGNDCWGYVSPSGREYALMGCNNKLAIVEVTNPSAPNYFASISHPSSTWGDIKVYKSCAYVVTETSGTGIQVIDLSNIDNHVVNLVRTLPAPDRSHNLAIDTTSGFLYSLGSRGGSGTTTCWDLSVPTNPVQVGSDSMTNIYIHDAQIVTYTSGPYAGRQILFGSAANLGAVIVDVTDKNNPSVVRTLTYPSIGYTHQAWLSADRHYLYLDDEMDETGSGFTTRTMVFDVSNLEQASLVTTFTSGESAIDHNLYVRDGFIFQANYRSGLRIFDANDNPTAPVQVGFFDTYPPNNSTGFDGAWSNFPFFPSGTVIISDINRGLFVVDPTQAVTRFEAPTSYRVLRGIPVQGNLASLVSSDDSYLQVRRNLAADEIGHEIWVQVEGRAVTEHPNSVAFVLEARAQASGFRQVLELFDFSSRTWVQADVRFAGTSDQTITVQAPGGQSRFVEPGTRAVRARVGWTNVAADVAQSWSIWIDRAVWKIVP
ncbi:MAG: choice-of-anchor B family protein [Fimbriimonadaceae bacterium]|nr:choice-of-anchor B family protein [Fimbriimonadaceae bacterium]